MSFGGGSSSGNSEILDFQKQEAAKAEQKEKERQARLSSGRDRIQAMFSTGGGSFTGPGSYSTELTHPNAAKTTRVYRGGPTNRYDEALARDGMYDAYRTVNNPNYGKTQEVWKDGETQNVSGIGDDFYSGYKNSIMDYYNPEVQNQFEEAKSQNLFDLARKGQLRSSAAVDRNEELITEKAMAEAQLKSNAENQTAALRGDMANAQQNALSLLQQTEDPTAAANAAQSEVNAIQGRAPDFSPMGELFRAGSLGYNSYQQAQNNRKYANSVPSSNPYVGNGRNVG